MGRCVADRPERESFWGEDGCFENGARAWRGLWNARQTGGPRL